MKVKEIMTEEVITIRSEDKVTDVLNLLFKEEISGFPVVNGRGKLVGMFTEKEILSYILPSYVEKVGRFIYEENPKATRKKFAELSKITVGQLMRTDVITTTEETTLSDVAKNMITHKARRIPVINEAGKLIGVVARCDVLRALAKQSEESSEG